MKPRLKQTLWIVVRSVVFAGAMFWVLKDVTLNDYATLPDGETARITRWVGTARDDPQTVIHVDTSAGPQILTLGELARKPDGSPDFKIGLRTVLQNSDSRLLLLGVLLYAPVGLVQSVRFTWMVRSQEIELSHWEGIKLTYAGNFLNFVALGTTGGDIFKAYYVSCHTQRKTEAVTTVFLDRAVGMIGLVTIAVLGMLLKFNDPKIRQSWVGIAILIAILAVGAVVVFSRRVRRMIHFDRLLAKLPFSDHIQRIDAATLRMRQHKKLLTAALLLTIVLQGLALTSMIVAGFGLGMQASWDLLPGYYAYLAMALLIAAVPISYQGGGTMDGWLQFALRGAYGNYSQILFLGFAMRLLQLLWSLPGALVPITGAHRPSTEKIAQLQALTATSKS